jgi:RNA polymerase sigma-70 factor, ECF subfamily
MPAVSDAEQLPVAAARAGDATAWDALFKRYQLPLYVYVFELLQNEQTTLDIVQETFLNSVRHIRTLRDDAKFGSWLFSIAHQKCQQHWRKPRREEPLPDDFLELASEETLPREVLIRAEQEEEFMSLVNQLSEAHRSVLLLHFLEDFPLDEIARITGVNVGTIKSRLHYAKKAMRTALAERTA